MGMIADAIVFVRILRVSRVSSSGSDNWTLRLTQLVRNGQARIQYGTFSQLYHFPEFGREDLNGQRSDSLASSCITVTHSFLAV